MSFYAHCAPACEAAATKSLRLFESCAGIYAIRSLRKMAAADDFEGEEFLKAQTEARVILATHEK